MQLSNYVVHGCGYDWTAGLGTWDTFIGSPTIQTLIAFCILVISAGGWGKLMKLYSHQLAGYMLLGFVCTSNYMLSMMRHEYTVNYLHYICVFCKAYIAFETATHLANSSELRQYSRSIALSALLHVTSCFVVSMVLYNTLIRCGSRTRPGHEHAHTRCLLCV